MLSTKEVGKQCINFALKKALDEELVSEFVRRLSDSPWGHGNEKIKELLLNEPHFHKYYAPRTVGSFEDWTLLTGGTKKFWGAMAFTGFITSLIGCAAALGYVLDRFAGWAFCRRQEKDSSFKKVIKMKAISR